MSTAGGQSGIAGGLNLSLPDPSHGLPGPFPATLHRITRPMITPTPVELPAAYNAEFNRMQRFGEIRPGIYRRRAAAIRAAIYVLLPDEPLTVEPTKFESEQVDPVIRAAASALAMVRQDERAIIRRKFFELVHALESWREQPDA